MISTEPNRGLPRPSAVKAVVHARGEGSPIVFLHGLFGDAEDFAPIDVRGRCLCVDLPGHGRAPLDQRAWEEAEGPGLARMARAVDEALEPLEAAHLVGYSMGGRIALWSALFGRRSWRSLTLLSASPGLSVPQERRHRVALDQARAEQIRAHGLPAFLTDWYRMELFADLRDRPGFSAQRDRRAQADPEAMATLIAAMSPGRQPDLWPHLEALRLPVLYVAGSRDRRYVRILERAASRSPQGRLDVIEGAGHSVHLERPAEVARRLESFFEGR